MILGRCPENDGAHHFVALPPHVDGVRCSCGAELSGVEVALSNSRARIAAATTEPGRLPLGAPMLPREDVVLLPYRGTCT